MRDENQILADLLIETKKLSKLVGLLVTSNLGATERIVLLDRAGLAPKEIAEILGTTSNLVSSSLYKDRKKQRKTTARSSK